jgi:hypothetical protein
MFDSQAATRQAIPRRLLTLLDLAEEAYVPEWGPSVATDIEFDQEGAPQFATAWGPSVGDDIPGDAEAPAC